MVALIRTGITEHINESRCVFVSATKINEKIDHKACASRLIMAFMGNFVGKIRNNKQEALNQYILDFNVGTKLSIAQDKKKSFMA